MSAPRPAKADRPPRGSRKVAEPHFLESDATSAHWRGRERFAVLDTDFGHGHRFLNVWQAWRDDVARCGRLHFIAVLPRTITHTQLLDAHRESTRAELARQLAAAWPVLTPNLHSMSFENGRVQLLLAPGKPAAWLPELVARVDAFFVDAAALVDDITALRLVKALSRLAAAGARLECEPSHAVAASALRSALSANGFEPSAGSQDAVMAAIYAPRFTPRHAPARWPAMHAPTQHAAIVGAGLAGSSLAWALAQQGWHSTVFDRHPAPAQEASGNPAGLFHGIVNAQDGVHARFNRAAALGAGDAVRIATTQHAVAGNAGGLLRLETAGASVAEMQAVLAHGGLPARYVQAVTAAQASALSGLALTQPAWFYPTGGWVQPQGLVRAFLERAGAASSFRGNTRVHSLQRSADGWRLLDEHAAVICESDVVVLANAGDALRLLGTEGAAHTWPIQPVRGQISQLPSHSQGLPCSLLPLTGSGYLLPPWQGRTLFGATSQAGDDDASVRDADHAQNLTQLARLTQTPLPIAPAACQGRTAWRWVTPDRLPVIGSVPDIAAATGARPLDQPRLVPRLPGLFVFTALGSRGITWCALGAQTLAAWIAGAPMPVEASLLDAIDPARFISKAVRREASRKALAG